MNTFQCVRVLDLHGSANKMERSPDGSEDRNVFDIRQGVAICLASRKATEAAVWHADLWGSREEKYAWLARHSTGDTSFTSLVPDSPYYFLHPQNTDCRDEYDSGWKINELMPVNSAGFITARNHFVVDFDRDELLARIADFADPKLSDAQIRSKYFSGSGSDKYSDGDTRGWKVPQARKRVQEDRKWRERVATCFYRPFDRRAIYWADWMVDWPRPEVMGHMLAGPNLAFHLCRQSVGEQWAHVLVATSIVDDCYVSNKTRERGYTHPLYLYPTAVGLGLSGKREANFKPSFLRALRESLKTDAQKNGFPKGFTPEDIFHYVYAMFHSPGYRSRYAQFLKIDFPRLPLTGKLELFRALARLGGELVALHLLESPKLDKHITTCTGPANPEVEKLSYARDTVWLDKAQTRGFRGIPAAVWKFHIGGYQVCEKWLKDRKGRTLSKQDIAHYHKIVVALNETIRVMKEIDEVIEKHGGWPGAFTAVK